MLGYIMISFSLILKRAVNNPKKQKSEVSFSQVHLPGRARLQGQASLVARPAMSFDA
jgi:hypothetical protein